MSEFEPATSDALAKAVREAAEGDHRAYRELVERHQGFVLANCKYMTRSDDDAEDLAQEVFVKAFFNLKSLASSARFTPWLKRIKVNHCLNFIRRKRGVEVDVDAETSEVHDELHVPASPDTDFERRARTQAVQNVLASMPDTLRLPLILCDMDGLSYQEAADELGLGLSALKMRLKRARESFRERYARREGTHDAEGTG